jgi:hypothetical protein
VFVVGDGGRKTLTVLLALFALRARVVLCDPAAAEEQLLNLLVRTRPVVVVITDAEAIHGVVSVAELSKVKFQLLLDPKPWQGDPHGSEKPAQVDKPNRSVATGQPGVAITFCAGDREVTTDEQALLRMATTAAAAVSISDSWRRRSMLGPASLVSPFELATTLCGLLSSARLVLPEGTGTFLQDARRIQPAILALTRGQTDDFTRAFDERSQRTGRFRRAALQRGQIGDGATGAIFRRLALRPAAGTFGIGKLRLLLVDEPVAPQAAQRLSGLGVDVVALAQVAERTAVS